MDVYYICTVQLPSIMLQECNLMTSYPGETGCVLEVMLAWRPERAELGLKDRVMSKFAIKGKTLL